MVVSLRAASEEDHQICCCTKPGQFIVILLWLAELKEGVGMKMASWQDGGGGQERYHPAGVVGRGEGSACPAVRNSSGGEEMGEQGESSTPGLLAT